MIYNKSWEGYGIIQTQDYFATVFLKMLLGCLLGRTVQDMILGTTTNYLTRILKIVNHKHKRILTGQI